jgi:hypothetical protein
MTRPSPSVAADILKLLDEAERIANAGALAWLRGYCQALASAPAPWTIPSPRPSSPPDASRAERYLDDVRKALEGISEEQTSPDSPAGFRIRQGREGS